MLRRGDAEEVYALEDERRKINEKLIEALGDHIEGDRWTHVYPYLLFCQLEAVDIEASVAACLGYLRFVADVDDQHAFERESLKGLVLPKEPKNA